MYAMYRRPWEGFGGCSVCEEPGKVHANRELRRSSIVGSTVKLSRTLSQAITT